MSSLKQDQLKGLETQLRERQRVLVDEIAVKRHDTASASTEEVMGGVGDPGDESVARMQTDLSIEEAGRDAEELAAVDAALGRIADGSYGYCDDCGLEIDYRRLQAQPSAMRCLECQTKHEKTFAHRGTPTL
jgi:DnaK suppressor protein